MSGKVLVVVVVLWIIKFLLIAGIIAIIRKIKKEREAKKK